MSDYMKPEEWLGVIQREYLQDFVKQGGAAVKFVVPLNETGPAPIVDGLTALAGKEGYFFAPVDAATTKIHLIEQLFFKVARQADWDDLSLAFLRNILGEHYKLPSDNDVFDLKKIAIANGFEEREIRPLINNRLRERLFQDYAMTQEFRIAMLWLCRYRLDPAEVGEELHQGIIEWLRGELNRVTALKSALIFQKIGRHNARNMLFSFAHWLKLTGRNGLILVLDIGRYTEDRPREPEGGALYYSNPAVLDCYEVLRQLVDDTDEAEYCFTCVVAPPRFVMEGDRRGVDAYTALKMRIWDEVRDRTRVDPLSSLIRVCECENPSVGL
jgi:hypothetical protein